MKLHDDEFEIDPALVRRLISAQFPRWAHSDIERTRSWGTDNAMFRLGSGLVVRLPRIERAVGSLDKEYRWLPRLAPFLRVQVPEPMGRGEPGQGYPWPWVVYRWLEGTNPVLGELAEADRLAVDLADFLRGFGSIDLPDGPATGRTPRSMDSGVRDAIARLDGLADVAAITRAWDAALEVPDQTGPPVWIHSDVAPGNLLLQGGRLTGVIDFSSVGVGDPANDLGVAWNLLPARARRIFAERLEVDEVTWLRGRGRALAQALVQLPYYHRTNPTLADQARHVIGQVLADA